MNNTDFTHQLMKAIQQTDEWDRIWKEDPKLQEAKAQLDEVMEQVGPQISAELRDSLWTSIYGLTIASETTAIPYGIRVAIAILGATTLPDYIVDHTEPVAQRGQVNGK